MLIQEDVSAIRLKDFTRVVGEEEVNEIRALAAGFQGKSLTQINSTAYGGGVAEILRNMVPLMRDCGLDVKWQVIKGSYEFFNVTKKIHNALQGMNVDLTDDERKIYIEYNKTNSQLTEIDSDYVVVHDNQPAPLIEFYPTRHGKWIWRCHVDLSTPNIAVWNFLEQFVSHYNAAIFSSEKYVIPSLRVAKTAIISPSINPLSDKNRELPEDLTAKILEKHGVHADKPIIAQVGRFDLWKDTLGVIDVYRLVKKEIPQVQLLLVASMASDDPEGWLYFEKTARHAGDDGDVHFLTDLVGVRDVEVNAFQRSANVMLQMSTREGFGLTVSEALWKGVPVVGRNVGGIPLQIVDGESGYLVNTVEDAAEKTVHLLKNADEAKKMGKAGRERVLKNFLITQNLKSYFKLLSDLP